MPEPGPHEVAFAIRGTITPADVPGLRAGVRLCPASDARVAVCDIESALPDAVTVDALARLQLAARARGCRIILCGASAELSELVAFMGLANVLTEE